MKAVVQRVLSASVEVEKEVVGFINQGLLVLLGAAKGDGDEDVQYRCPIHGRENSNALDLFRLPLAR